MISTCQTCSKSFEHPNRKPSSGRINPKFCSWSCRFAKTPEERFWDKVSNSDNPNDCWVWTASTNIHGYGQLNINSNMIFAHRFSFELHKGEIPEGMCVCHSCDNPVCVNPAHLWLGTPGDNIRDRNGKDRANFAEGERVTLAKLTEDQVRNVRVLYESGMRQVEIARIFGIARQTVHNIILRKTWKHI